MFNALLLLIAVPIIFYFAWKAVRTDCARPAPSNPEEALHRAGEEADTRFTDFNSTEID